jgi:hypothetical protein
MASSTVHAQARVWERYKVAPTRREWDEAVGAIMARAMGEESQAVKMRLMKGGLEEWIVRVGRTFIRAAYSPRTACIVTVLPSEGR